MIHERELLDRLGNYSSISFDGEVFRATRTGLDPLTPSTSGGRWSPREVPGSSESVATLYTSLTREGALAELAFHYAQLTPFPSKPVLLHRLQVTSSRTLRLLRADLVTLGVIWEHYATLNYDMTQKVGAVVAFLGCDGLIAPSARWPCENLMIFTTNHGYEHDLTALSSEEVKLREWAHEKQLLHDENLPSVD